MDLVERKKRKTKPLVEVKDAKQGTEGEVPSARKATRSEQSKYSDVLKAMQSGAKLEGLGADVHSIIRTRTGEMILELKRDKDRNGAAYKRLAEEVLDE